MKVIVIGAGLGGLCLAQGLSQEGIEVEVYEQDPGVEARFQGYRIGLNPSGFEALKSCLPVRLHALLEATSGDLTGPGRLLDEQLNDIRMEGREAKTDAVEESVVIDRHVLRHLLLAGLQEKVHFGKKLTRYETLSDGTVRVCFADSASACCDLLVGADGVGSAVRRQLVGPVEPVDTGLRGVIGRTPLDRRFASLVPGRGTMVSGPGLDMFLGKMQFREPPHLAAEKWAPGVYLPETPSYLRWIMLLPPEHPGVLGQKERKGTAAIATILELIQGWHPDLRELVRQADRDNSGFGPIRALGPVPAWESQAVTMLGDAVHATAATGGNGANTALLDAALLCAKLGEVNRGAASLPPSLEDYNRQVLSCGSDAVQQSLRKADEFQNLGTRVRNARHPR
ncbi:FAD-dependent oxidoreductase [Paenibacillus humicola]|uniref:FAD-dependent oxidoreductase n=1 Tax=Paenibacillus humicola TaxID=3110540 RepID=UPI00237BD210|nr:FAD-dependent monooxygenase [Paenibacillus humicola]